VDREKEIRRWSWRLRDLMREGGRTQRSLEVEAGWGKGYLTQVLRDGRPALKVEHNSRWHVHHRHTTHILMTRLDCEWACNSRKSRL
jgi:hypothetical protein